MAVRRSLLWMLAGVGLLSVAAVWHQPTTAVTAAVEPAERAARPAGTPAALLPLDAASVPGRIERDALEPAKSDPFFMAAAPAATTTVVVPPPPLPRLADTVPPPPPPAPAMNHRFVGAMHTPEGARLVFLSDGDAPIRISPGTALRSGYRVESVDEREVRLVLPGTEHRASVPLPPVQ